MMNRQSQATGKVLVLGNDDRSLLAVIRSLGRRRLEVHVGWCPNDSLAHCSRYTKRVHELPPYAPDNDTWKKGLLSLLQRQRFDLVIPCSDPALMPLQANRFDFEPHASIYLLNDEAYEVAFDKIKTDEMARSLGIPVPRWDTVSGPDAVGRILSEFKFPVILKPRASYRLNNLGNKSHVRKVDDAAGLTLHLGALLSRGEVLVQENFIGTGVGVELLAEHGEVLLAFQHVRIHEPVVGGGSSYRMSVAPDPELLDAARRFIKAMNYTGVAMVEFRCNFKTGDWILVEINGRFWGSLPLAVAAGADFPYYLYRLLVHGQRDFPQHYRTGLYGRNLRRDLEWVVQSFKRDRLSPSDGDISLRQVAKEAVNLLALRERSDTFVMDDPKPGFVDLAHLIRDLRARTAHKIRLTFLSIPMIRRCYAAKTQSALKRSRTVLFLCKGNICRSPFAQSYAETVFPRSVTVISCGYTLQPGRVCPPEAVQAAKEAGCDLSSHSSRVLTEEIVRQADLILTFDEENRRTLIHRYPNAKRKLYRLSLLTANGPVNIEDPYGRGIDDFKSVYRRIRMALDSAASAWSGGA